jgi:hypothetical protein
MAVSLRKLAFEGFHLLCFYVFSLVQNARIYLLPANLRMSGVCLEGWWPKNTTNYICLEGSVWQIIQFECKFTYVWRLFARLVAQKHDKVRMSGRLGVAKYAI